jgi:LmbE family N-acetylglucosaminyl deacetylase
MFRISFGNSVRSLRRVWCLGAHCDDIEIGCGGSILRLLNEIPGLEITWIVFSSTAKRRQEGLRSAALFLKEAKRRKILIKKFRDSFLPYQGGRVKEFFEALKKEPAPDLIFTHFRHDLHQDHRLIAELTWSTFRNHLILEYEIPKYDGDLGSPNFFVELDESLCQTKTQNILRAFPSQTGKQWFTEDSFRAILRIRGVESNAKERYAEAFYLRKAVL